MEHIQYSYRGDVYIRSYGDSRLGHLCAVCTSLETSVDRANHCLDKRYVLRYMVSEDVDVVILIAVCFLIFPYIFIFVRYKISAIKARNVLAVVCM